MMIPAVMVTPANWGSQLPASHTGKCSSAPAALPEKDVQSWTHHLTQRVSPPGKEVSREHRHAQTSTTEDDVHRHWYLRHVNRDHFHAMKPLLTLRPNA
jgi:hypothetical protein